MVQYIKYQMILQFRIPIDDNGNAGTPEIIKKFTAPMKETYQAEQKKKEAKKVLQEEFGKSEKCEEIEL